MKTDLTIVTATYKRHDQLGCQIRRVQEQVLNGLVVEHLIVVDGADDQISLTIAKQLGCKAILSTRPRGFFGAGAKQTGIEAAQGDYIACWDDDDFYERHAAKEAWVSVVDTDIGICQMRHLRPADNWEQIIPNPGCEPDFGLFTGTSMTVSRVVAAQVPIFDGNGDRGTDWRWFQRMLAAGAKYRINRVTIGMMIDTYYPYPREGDSV